MSDSRDEKRGKFAEGKRSGFSIKPMYILGSVAIVAVIAVAAILLTGDSGSSEISAGNTEVFYEEPAIIDAGTADSGTEISNSSETNTDKPATSEPPLSTLSVANFEIEGMTCGGCSNGIMRGLGDADGVTMCNVSWSDKEGIVEYDPAVTNPQEIAEFITGMGFATTVVE